MSDQMTSERPIENVDLLLKHYRGGESARRTVSSSREATRKGWKPLAKIGLIAGMMAVSAAASNQLIQMISGPPQTAPQVFTSLDGYTKATGSAADQDNQDVATLHTMQFRNFEKTIGALKPALEAARHETGPAADRLNGWAAMIEVARKIKTFQHRGEAIDFWVNTNIQYDPNKKASDANWDQSPVQTLTTGKGECGDTADLIALGMVEAGTPSKNVGVLDVRIDYPGKNPSYHAVAVANKGLGNTIYGNMVGNSADVESVSSFFDPGVVKLIWGGSKVTPVDIQGFGWSQTYAAIPTQTARVEAQEEYAWKGAAGSTPQSDWNNLSKIHGMALALRAKTDRESAPTISPAAARPSS